MPEGPEIWCLSHLINFYYKEEKTLAYGKHLFLLDKKEEWHFGLSGKVFINNDNELQKKNSGYLPGKTQSFENVNNSTSNLGLDFMTANEEEIKNEIEKWKNTKKKLAGLLLDQKRISGIGVAWGSEILHHANLSPDLPSNKQNIENLSESILFIREQIKKKYQDFMDEKNNRETINEWFENLYEIREMKVYKKGKKINVLGRNWWIT